MASTQTKAGLGHQPKPHTLVLLKYQTGPIFRSLIYSNFHFYPKNCHVKYVDNELKSPKTKINQQKVPSNDKKFPVMTCTFQPTFVHGLLQDQPCLLFLMLLCKLYFYDLKYFYFYMLFCMSFFTICNIFYKRSWISLDPLFGHCMIGMCVLGLSINVNP